MVTYYELRKIYKEKRNTWTDVEVKEFITEYSLLSENLEELDFELTNLIMCEENLALQERLNKVSADLIISKQECRETYLELEKCQTVRRSLEEEVALFENKEKEMDLLKQELQETKEKYILEKETNDLLHENNKKLQNKIVELTQEKNNKETPSSDALVVSLMQCSKDLGVAHSENIFLKNQLSRDSLKINQQIRLLNASKKKEDDTILRCGQKVDKINIKFSKKRKWFNDTIVEREKRIVSLNNENIYLQQENSELKSKIEYMNKIFNRIPHFLVCEDEISYKNRYIIITETLQKMGYSVSDLTKLKSALEKERQIRLKNEKRCSILEHEKNRLLADISSIEKSYYDTMNKIEKIKEDSNLLYLKKITNYQEEVRQTKENLEKSKILYENSKLEIQNLRLRI